MRDKSFSVTIVSRRAARGVKLAPPLPPSAPRVISLFDYLFVFFSVWLFLSVCVCACVRACVRTPLSFCTSSLSHPAANEREGGGKVNLPANQVFEISTAAGKNKLIII